MLHHANLHLIHVCFHMRSHQSGVNWLFSILVSKLYQCQHCTFVAPQQQICQVWSESDELFLRYANHKLTQIPCSIDWLTQPHNCHNHFFQSERDIINAEGENFGTFCTLDLHFVVILPILLFQQWFNNTQRRWRNNESDKGRDQ